MCLVFGFARNISTNVNSIPMLNGKNFKALQDNILIILEVMDLDLVLQVDKPAELTYESISNAKREMERWE